MVVVLAQLCGTSLWFSANSAVDDLRVLWRLTPSDLGWLTDAVQAGFIAGTMGALQNSLGFPLATGSIALATSNYPLLGDRMAWLLLLGPLLGLLAMRRLVAAAQPPA